MWAGGGLGGKDEGDGFSRTLFLKVLSRVVM